MARKTNAQLSLELKEAKETIKSQEAIRKVLEKKLSNITELAEVVSETLDDIESKKLSNRIKRGIKAVRAWMSRRLLCLGCRIKPKKDRPAEVQEQPQEA